MSEVREENLEVKLSEVAKFLEDDEVMETLEYVVKLIAKPDVGADKAAPLIVKLQAYAFDFKMKAKYYMFIGKHKDVRWDEEDGKPVKGERKNYYLSLSEEIDKLVAALKFVARSY